MGEDPGVTTAVAAGVPPAVEPGVPPGGKKATNHPRAGTPDADPVGWMPGHLQFD